MVDNYQLLFCGRRFSREWKGWAWSQLRSAHYKTSYPANQWHRRHYEFSKDYPCGATSAVEHTWFIMCDDCARKRGLMW